VSKKVDWRFFSSKCARWHWK